MVFYFREKTTSYVCISFFLSSRGVLKPEEREERGTAIAITRKHAVSINPSIQNPLVMSPARAIVALRAALRCCTLRYPLSPLRGQQKIIKHKRWMLSTREWLTFLPTNTTSRKWLATPLGNDATLTKSRSDVSRPTAAFRSFVDAKLLNRFRFTIQAHQE